MVGGALSQSRLRCAHINKNEGRDMKGLLRITWLLLLCFSQVHAATTQDLSLIHI